MGWMDLSVRARLGIVLAVVLVVGAGLGGLFLATGGTELLFGPTTPVTHATIDQVPDHRRVVLTGKIDLPASAPIDADTLWLYLLDPTDSSRRVGVGIKVPQAGATVGPNQMGHLPLAYTHDDLHVRLADGSYASWYDQVRVTGRVSGCTAGGRQLRCIDAELIEAAD